MLEYMKIYSTACLVNDETNAAECTISACRSSLRGLGHNPGHSNYESSNNQLVFKFSCELVAFTANSPTFSNRIGYDDKFLDPLARPSGRSDQHHIDETDLAI